MTGKLPIRLHWEDYLLTITGEVSDVRSSVQAAAGSAESSGRLARHVVIPRPHPELSAHL